MTKSKPDHCKLVFFFSCLTRVGALLDLVEMIFHRTLLIGYLKIINKRFFLVTLYIEDFHTFLITVRQLEVQNEIDKILKTMTMILITITSFLYINDYY